MVEIDNSLDMRSKCYTYFKNHAERVVKLYKGLQSEPNSSWH